MMTWYEIVPLSKQLFWGEWCDLPLYSSLFLLSISSFHLISLPFGFILLVSSRRILLPTSSPHHFPHLSISPVLNLLSSYVSNRYLQNTIPLHCPFCRKICSLTLSLLNFVSIFIHYSSVLFFVWSVCLEKKQQLEWWPYFLHYLSGYGLCIRPLLHTNISHTSIWYNHLLYVQFFSVFSILCYSVVSLCASLIVFHWQLNYFVSSHCKGDSNSPFIPMIKHLHFSPANITFLLLTY